MGKIIRNGIPYSGSYDNATSVNYDNSVSGLDARTVQEGLDELSKGSKGAFPVDNLLSTATDIPLSANQGRVLDEKISALNDSLGGIRYNSETDMIQILFDGTWSDWQKAGMERTYIYNSGVENMALDLTGYSLSTYTKTNNWVKNSNYLSCQTPTKSYYSIFGTNSTSSISTFKKLHVLYESGTGSKEAIIELSDLTSTNVYVSISYLHASDGRGILMIMLSTTKVANNSGSELKRYTDNISGTLKVHKIWLSNN